MTVQNKDYLLLFCILDVYLSKFPSHEMTKIRISTKMFRPNGFSDHQDLKHLEKVLATTTKRALTYVYSEEVQKEVARLLKKNQETEKPDFYCPHLVTMGLLNKFPYSAASNPNFSCWVHTIDCLMGSNRPKKGKAISDIRNHCFIKQPLSPISAKVVVDP